MATALKYPTSKNAVQKTLDAALLTGVTAAVTLNSVVGIQNKAGVFVVDRVDSNGTATPSKREYISFTGVSGSTLTNLTRNADGGGTDQDHAVGAIVEFVSDVLQEQAIIDGLLETITTAGALDTTKVVDLTTAQTLTNKTLTSPKIGTNIKDTNGNELITLTATGSAVNEITYANAATGNAPSITASGDDTNIDLTLKGKGSGNVKLGTALLKFPNADGSANQALVTNGSGTLSFATAGSTDGWTDASESWAYASASTITVPSGAATKYAIGDKIKWTQTTVKYGVITAVADTLLTIAINTDYTVANAAISANYYSHTENPIGFPGLFNFTPTITSGGGSITSYTATAQYAIRNRNVLLFYYVHIITKGTASGSMISTLPFTVQSQNPSGYGCVLSTAKAVVIPMNGATSFPCYLYDGTTLFADDIYIDYAIIVKI